jgi:uncharacterized protein DUF5658
MTGMHRSHTRGVSVSRAQVRDLFGTPSFRMAWLIYVAASVADLVTTARGLSVGLRERNPIAASLYGSAGLPALWALKIVVLATILGGLMLLPRRVAVAVTASFAAVMVLDVVANLHALAALRH